MEEGLKIEAEAIDVQDWEVYTRNKKSVEEIAQELHVSEIAIRNVINELWLELLYIGNFFHYRKTIYLNDRQVEKIVQYIKRDIHR